MLVENIAFKECQCAGRCTVYYFANTRLLSATQTRGSWIGSDRARGRGDRERSGRLHSLALSWGLNNYVGIRDPALTKSRYVKLVVGLYKIVRLLRMRSLAVGRGPTDVLYMIAIDIISTGYSVVNQPVFSRLRFRARLRNPEN